MAFSTNEFTRLPEPTKPPLQRWQKMATRPKSFSGQLATMASAGSPLRARTMNAAATAFASTRTPKGEYKSKSQPSSPTASRKTPAKTPKASNPKTPMSGKKTPNISCRFIPGRSGIHDEYSCFMMMQKDVTGCEDTEKQEADDEDHDRESSPPREEFQKALLAAACNGEPPQGVLSFSVSTPTVGAGSFLSYTSNSALGSASLACSGTTGSHKKEKRKVPKSEEKILDAPSLVDDYYINVLDWGRNNLLAVALGPTVYLWNATDGSVTELLEMDDENSVTALSWAQKRSYLAVGLKDGSIQLWDADKQKKVRTMRGHCDRVSSLHWNSHTLASGSRSGAIHLHDVRKQEHCVGSGKGHQLEVCGLKWSLDGRALASGGNDNIVCIWDPNTTGMSRPVQVLRSHQAAVKALAWSPCQSTLLATGGGSADKCIKFWNTSTGECYQSLDTKSPVSSLVWSRDGREILSSHGQPRNQLTLWQYPSLTKVADLKGHKGRVLHIATSPRRTRVASAGADETLRVWKCFEPAPSRQNSYLEDSMSSLMLSGIY